MHHSDHWKTTEWKYNCNCDSEKQVCFLYMLGENTTETWMSVYKIAAACCVRMLCVTVSVKYLTVAEGDKNEHLVGGMK